jgi:hypothetical protein
MNRQSAFRGASRRHLPRTPALGHTRRNVAPAEPQSRLRDWGGGAIYRRPTFRCRLPPPTAFGIKCALNRMVSDESIVGPQILVVPVNRHATDRAGRKNRQTMRASPITAFPKRVVEFQRGVEMPGFASDHLSWSWPTSARHPSGHHDARTCSPIGVDPQRSPCPYTTRWIHELLIPGV